MLPEYEELTMVMVPTSFRLMDLGTAALASFPAGQKSVLDVVLATWPARPSKIQGGLLWLVRTAHSPVSTSHEWLVSHMLIFG